MGNYIRFDWAMMKLLLKKENLVVLEGFVSTVLDKDIEIEQILECGNDCIPRLSDLKPVDLLVTDSEGTRFFVEVQYENDFAYYKRTLFEPSDLLNQVVNGRVRYDGVGEVYIINIAHYEGSKGLDYVYRGKTEFRGVHYNGLLSLSPFKMGELDCDVVSSLYPGYYILNVNNFDGIAQSCLEEWIAFLKDGLISDSPKAKGLLEAKKIMLYDSISDEEKYAYDKDIDTRVILRDNIVTARGEGMLEGRAECRAKGRVEGHEEEKRQTVKRMKESGLDIDLIVIATGLTKEEVEGLL